jgi:hypothetical protein
MKLTLYIKNFKKISEIDESFLSGYLYLVKGRNNIGKTSFWQSLRMIFKTENNNNNILQFGTKEGFVEVDIEKGTEIVGADGEKYIAKCEFKEGKEDKFTLIMPDATVRKSKKDIRDIFRYNDVTPEEFLGWGLTEAGRRKQAEMILEFLPATTQTRIADIDKQINSKNGILYITRSGKNETLQGYKKVVEQTFPLSAEEESMLSKETSAIETINGIKKELEALELTRSDQGDIIQKKADLQLEYDTLSSRQIITNDSFATYVETWNNEEEKLLARLKEIKSLRDAAVETNKTYNKEIIEQLNNIQKQIEEIEPSTFDQDKYDTLVKRKEAGQEFINKINNIKTKKENIELNEKRLEQAKIAWKEIDDKIEALRIEKKTLFEQAKLPMDNIIISDGELFYVDDKGNQMAFTEEQISYSVAGKRIAKLLLERNKNLPIICIGKASEYDQESLEEISLLAQQYDAIIFADKVEPQIEELTIEVFEK